MNRRKKSKGHECVGGPLCGTRYPNMGRFVYVDQDGCPHFYRRIRIARNDHSAVATFHHYFGTNIDWATHAHPYLMPGDRAFRPMI